MEGFPLGQSWKGLFGWPMMSHGTMPNYDRAVLADAPPYFWKMDEQIDQGNAQPTLVNSGTAGTGANLPYCSGLPVIGAESPEGPYRRSPSAGYFPDGGGGTWGQNFGNDWANPPITIETLVWRSNGDTGDSRLCSSERSDFGGAWGIGFTRPSGQPNGLNVGYPTLFYNGNVVGSVPIQNRCWSHYAWVIYGSPGLVQCWLNGKKIYDQVTTLGGNRSFGPFRIGDWGPPFCAVPQDPFAGKASRVAIYNYAVGEDRMLAHYQAFANLALNIPYNSYITLG